jgi:hypothetical protein
MQSILDTLFGTTLHLAFGSTEIIPYRSTEHRSRGRIARNSNPPKKYLKRLPERHFAVKNAPWALVFQKVRPSRVFIGYLN